MSIFIPRRCALEQLIASDGWQLFSLLSNVLLIGSESVTHEIDPVHASAFSKVGIRCVGFQLLLVPPGCPFETKLETSAGIDIAFCQIFL